MNNYCDINSINYNFILCYDIISWKTLFILGIGIFALYSIIKVFFIAEEAKTK